MSSVPRILPLNLRQTFLVETKVKPQEPLYLTLQSSSSHVIVAPTQLYFLPNQTYSQLVRTGWAARTIRTPRPLIRALSIGSCRGRNTYYGPGHGQYHDQQHRGSVRRLC